jgi:hypothetical protein
MRSRFVLSVAAAAMLLPVAAPPVHAQDGFLFRQPQAQVTVRGGPLLFRAQSDLYDELIDEFTIGRRDFRGPAVALEVAWLASPRFDIAASLGWAESENRSEYRDWVDDDGNPIEQTTRLRVLPLSATVRYRPLPRGRTLSALAWVPARTSPYVGAGAGFTWYRLVQEGEFIRGEDFAIFVDRLESGDSGLSAHAVAGLDHWITPRLGLNAEARYNHGSAPLGSGFRGFDDLDLGGMQVSLGMSFRW